MKNKLVIEEVVPQADVWNSRVRNSLTSNLHQTTHWANYEKDTMNSTPRYIVYKDEEGNIVGQLILLESTLFHRAFARGEPLALLHPLAKKLMKTIRWLDGPVIIDEKYRNQIYSQTIEYVLSISGVVAIDRITPHFSQQTKEVHTLFTSKGFHEQKWGTVLVDLNRPIDEIWMSFKGGKIRTPIRKVERQGVRMKEITSMKEMKVYYDLLDRHHKRLNIRSNSYDRYKNFYLHLKDHAKMFIVYHHEHAVGAIGVKYFGDTLELFSPVISQYCKQHKLYIGEYMHWELIKWGVKNGFSTYDLMGVRINPRNKKEQGIKDFKEKFGELHSYKEFTKVLMPKRCFFFTKLAGAIQHE